MSDYETIAVERDGAVDWLTLNRPDRLNALDMVMTAEITAYLSNVEHRRETRIIVIRGAGRAFCAGLDLGEAAAEGMPGVPEILAKQRAIANIFMLMRKLPQAIVSLVHGAACGGGFAMALASDIRIAGESARMNAAFVCLGLSACDMGVSYFLPRMVGASVASELMMTGDFIHADRALALGLVSRVVPDDRLEEEAAPIVKSILATSPLGLRLTKECLRMSIDAPSLEAVIAMEDRNQALCVASGEFQEGVAAFREKRTPSYPIPTRANSDAGR